MIIYGERINFSVQLQYTIVDSHSVLPIVVDVVGGVCSVRSELLNFTIHHVQLNELCLLLMLRQHASLQVLCVQRAQLGINFAILPRNKGI